MSKQKIQTFNTLIKISENQLNDLKQRLHALTIQREELQKMISNIESQILFEIANFKNLEYAFILDNYMKNANEKKDKYTSHIVLVDKEIANISQNILLKFSELKKYEIAKQNRIDLNLEEEKKLEIKMLDELSGLISSKLRKNSA